MQILFGIVFKPQIELGMYFTISDFKSVKQVFEGVKKNKMLSQNNFLSYIFSSFVLTLMQTWFLRTFF